MEIAMLHHYSFQKARVTCGQRKSQNVLVNLDVDVQDDDPFAPPPPAGHYGTSGFACRGELTFEWPNDNSCYFKKMLEVELVLLDEAESTKLKIVLLDMIDSALGMPGARPGQPAKTKHYTWSFLCVQKPVSDGLGLFPEAIKRAVMKVFVFTRFPGVWNSTQTSAVITAPNRQQAIVMLNAELSKKGIAPLQEGGYSLLELDPTTPTVTITADGDD